MLVTIKSDKKKYFYLTNVDVQYIEQQNDEVHVHLKSKETLIILDTTVNELDQKLMSVKFEELKRHWRIADVR